MRLLICTQAVDLDDPVLAFFHRWIEEFATQCEEVHVICLKEGRHTLPAHVQVHSLGKESGRSRVKYIARFYRYAWSLRRSYDAVFVHMNSEYVVLGGLLWLLLWKRVGLWYIHPHAPLLLRVALPFVRVVMSASKKSFPLDTGKLRVLGHAIDTDFFSPGARRAGEGKLHVMQVARISPVKRIECVVQAVEMLAQRGIPASLDIYGEARADKHKDDYTKRIAELVSQSRECTLRGAAEPTIVRDAYRSHDVHVNATRPGSYDKVVFESMACGTITVVSNDAFRGVVPDSLFFADNDAASLAAVLAHLSAMPPDERHRLAEHLRDIAEARCGVRVLVEKILKTYVEL